MRVHLIAPPNTQTTRAYSLDGFTSATIRFAKVLKLLGYEVFLYGSEENEAPCHEFISVISKDDQKKMLGDCPYQYAAKENKYLIWSQANKRAIIEIGKRKKERDFICLIGGTSQKEIADAFPDLPTIEYSIGYEGTFSNYRVYESHAWRHFSHGAQAMTDGRFFDTVIPLFFDSSEFELVTDKEKFLLYVGRLTPRKGIAIACEAAHAAGMPLKVIGHGDEKLVTHGAEYLGALDQAERNNWMARATALLAPTQYIEPFGATVVEAQFCGTPAITTDFGGFTDTVRHGITGFRCNMLEDFVQAIEKAHTLEPRFIRHNAENNFSIEAVVPAYREYFERVATLWGRGWYTLKEPA